MIRAFKKWLAEAAYEGLHQTEATTRINKLHDMFSNNMAAMVAFKIDNGYVVRCMAPSSEPPPGRSHGFVYCPDHQAIADYIVSSAMKDRLGIQSEMFGKNDAAQQRKQVNIIPRSSQSQPHGY